MRQDKIRLVEYTSSKLARADVKAQLVADKSVDWIPDTQVDGGLSEKKRLVYNHLWRILPFLIRENAAGLDVDVASKMSYGSKLTSRKQKQMGRLLRARRKIQQTTQVLSRLGMQRYGRGESGHEERSRYIE